MDSWSPDDSARPVLRIFTTRKGRDAHVALVGDLDLTAAGGLLAWVRNFTAGPPPAAVRLDLSDLGFADLAGLRALAEACALLQARGAAVELTGMPASLSRLAGLTGADLCGHSGRPSVDATV
jgi:anti-anti-sigma factor